MEYKWFEDLPAKCPPTDASECQGTVYRIANGNPASPSDFFSQRHLQPLKIFEGVDECICRSLSVFSDFNEAHKRRKLPKFRKAHIVEIIWRPKDGKEKKTFGPFHHSWWRSVKFDITQTKVIDKL